MIQFYYNLSPNPMKVALFLEEAGLPYEPKPIDTRRGQQFSAEYLAINPNGKTPARRPASSSRVIRSSGVSFCHG